MMVNILRFATSISHFIQKGSGDLLNFIDTYQL